MLYMLNNRYTALNNILLKLISSISLYILTWLLENVKLYLRLTLYISHTKTSLWKRLSENQVSLVQKDTWIPIFIAALFTIAKTWKQPKHSSTDEWIKKIWCIHTMEYYSPIKKNEITPFAATWMDLETVLLSDVRKTNIVWYCFYAESKKWYK